MVEDNMRSKKNTLRKALSRAEWDPESFGLDARYKIFFELECTGCDSKISEVTEISSCAFTKDVVFDPKIKKLLVGWASVTAYVKTPGNYDGECATGLPRPFCPKCVAEKYPYLAEQRKQDIRKDNVKRRENAGKKRTFCAET